MSWNEEYKENHYYLKRKGVYSDIFTVHIEKIFHKRMRDIYGESIDLSKNGPKGAYSSVCTQDRWEEFYNGFRLGEDA